MDMLDLRSGRTRLALVGLPCNKGTIVPLTARAAREVGIKVGQDLKEKEEEEYGPPNGTSGSRQKMKRNTLYLDIKQHPKQKQKKNRMNNILEQSI